MFNFENLEVYKRSLKFANLTYNIINKWPKECAFSLTDQLRKAALSIVLNIAEGASRTKLEFKRFLTISRGSSHECAVIIEIAYKQGIIDPIRKEDLLNELVIISKMLSKLKSSIA